MTFYYPGTKEKKQKIKRESKTPEQMTKESTTGRIYYSKNERKSGTMKSEIESVYKILADTGKARENYRMEVASLTSELNHAKAVKASNLEIEKLQKQIQQAELKQREFEGAKHTEIMGAIDKVTEASKAKHKEFSKKSELPGALSTIQAVGENMDMDTFDSIVSPFLLDAASLKVIRASLVKSGAKVGVAQIDNLLYNEDEAFANVKAMAANGLSQPGKGNLNAVSSKLAEIVKRDGIVVDPVCDPQGVIEAARMGARLPTEALKRAEDVRADDEATSPFVAELASGERVDFGRKVKES